MSANDRPKSEVLAERRARFNEPFNQPAAAANYEHWIKAAFWTPEEAIALTLGREPDAVSPDKLLAYLQKHQDFDSQGLLERYHELSGLVRRGIEVGELDEERIAPETFIAWAKRRRIAHPRQIDALLGSAAIDEGEADQAAEARITELEREITALRDENQRLKQAENAKIRLSLQKLALGMAVTKFQFVPNKRNSAATNIEAKLSLIGIKIDQDTIRRRLQEAAEEIEFEPPNS